jgi:hypothetical protein
MSLTEGIGTSVSHGESTSVSECISPHASEDVHRTTSGSHPGERIDSTESVTVTIKSSAGYEDSEVFTLRGKKAANAFARRVMAVSLRAHDRRDDDASE